MGHAFEETLAPDTDPAVVVGTPVGRSEPTAFADRFVTAAVTGLVVNGSICCVVKTSTLLGVTSKFLTLLGDSLITLERGGGKSRFSSRVLYTRRVGGGDIADLLCLVLRDGNSCLL